MSILIAYDCTRANIGRAPAGLLAGYTTGSSDIRWTAADWAAHPGAVRIDQDPAASDGTADVLDVEQYAATLADVPGWSKQALASYRSGKRPGQRSPVIYCSQASVTPVANVLTGAGLADGSVGLFIANWNLSQVQAVAQVLAAGGPFPVHGLQFRNAGSFDVDVFSFEWLNARSGAPQPAPAPAAFGPPRNLAVRAGDSSVLVERCDRPASGPAPDHYEVSVFTGSFPSPRTLVWERFMRAAPQQFGSLQDIPSGTHMTLRAVAVAAGGARSAYADARFEMP
jgi:hypothetical protein